MTILEWTVPLVALILAAFLQLVVGVALSKPDSDTPARGWMRFRVDGAMVPAGLIRRLHGNAASVR